MQGTDFDTVFRTLQRLILLLAVAGCPTVYAAPPADHAASAWDCVEDGAEDIGSAVERQWERIEDGLFGETEEERREEARERWEDEQEELAEARRGHACRK